MSKENWLSAIFPNQPAVISKQPVNAEPITRETFNSYVYWSIFNIFFCNFLCGIFGLIFAYQAKTKFVENKIDEAETNKRRSQLFNVVSTLLGFGVYILVVILIVTKLRYV